MSAWSSSLSAFLNFCKTVMGNQTSTTFPNCLNSKFEKVSVGKRPFWLRPGSSNERSRVKESWRFSQLFVNNVNNVRVIYSEIISSKLTCFSILQFLIKLAGNEKMKHLYAD